VATDADHPASSLVYSLVSGPAGAVVTADGQLSWTANRCEQRAGVPRAGDGPGGAISERSFAVSVTSASVNAAPVLAPVASRSAVAGTQVAFQLVATDADHPASSLVYSLVSGPAGAAVSADGRFSWTAAGADTVQAFRVRVTDPAGAIGEQTVRDLRHRAAVNAAPCWRRSRTAPRPRGPGSRSSWPRPTPIIRRAAWSTRSSRGRRAPR
jgi:hypothetical protein